MNKNKNWTKWFYWFTFGAAIITIYKTLDSFNEVLNWINKLLSVVMPFILGILISYLFYTPCKQTEKIFRKIKIKIISKKSRGLSVLVVYTIAILLIVITINFVIPAIFNSVGELANNMPYYYNIANDYLSNLPDESILSKLNVRDLLNNIKDFDITHFLSFDSIVQYIRGVIGVANGIFTTFVTIIVSIYILLERGEILKFIRNLSKALFKKSTYENLDKYFIKTNEIFFKYISSQILDSFIVGIIIAIALSIMKVKYAVLLGFFIGLFNIIPYFGAIIAVIVAILITLLTGGFYQALWVSIVIIILQQIDANIINPKIVGNSLKLSPLLVIFSVTIGGAYFGVLGMFLSVPITAVIKILILDYIEYKNNFNNA